MLSIGKLAAGQADYYLEQAGKRVVRASSVSTGVEDYYFASYAPRGQWAGRAAAELHLAGAVRDDELREVLDGSRVGLVAGPPRIPGFDVTFSAPKGVSVLFGIGDATVQDTIVRAHETAVHDALRYLERHTAFGRRGRGGARAVQGSGLVAAAFRHGTSRAGDPQLHTHVLVANLVRGVDGRWSALDGRRLYTHAKTAGYLYEARLRSELTRQLGLEWRPVQKGIAEPAGIPPHVLKAFSRRRAEIEQALEMSGREGPSAARVAVLATRRRKREIDPAILTAEWRARAEELAFGSRKIAAMLSAAREQAPSVDIPSRLLSAEGLTRDRSTFSRRDVVQAWCEALPPGVPVTSESIERDVDRLLRSPEVVPLHPARGAAALRRRDGRIAPSATAEPRYTTAELLAVEQRVLARAGAPACAPTARAEATSQCLADRPVLSDEQAAMVEAVTQSDARVSVVVGKAGTGKTFALDAARAAWEASGVRVIGAAVARRAARELEEGAGISSTSLAALLRDVRTGRARSLLRRSVVVLDEASLVGTRDLAVLVEQVAAVDGKLVLVGDDGQLPSIRAGGAFDALASRLGASVLHQNRRQTAAWERAALDLLRHGESAAALELYRAHGRLVVGSNSPELREALVADWWKTEDPDAAVMIALRRGDVADLNGRARAVMNAAGRLGAITLRVGDSEFATGDRVMLRRNDRVLQVANGERGRVVSVDPVRRTLTLDLSGRSVRLDRRYVDLPGALDYGYAITGHVAQGMTTERAFVLGTDTLFREWGYVAMSRGRNENRFYAVIGEPTDRDEIAPREARQPALEEIREALARSRAQRLAIEDYPGPAAPAPVRRPIHDARMRRRAWLAQSATALDPPRPVVDLLGPRPERPVDIDWWRARIADPELSREVGR